MLYGNYITLALCTDGVSEVLSSRFVATGVGLLPSAMDGESAPKPSLKRISTEWEYSVCYIHSLDEIAYGHFGECRCHSIGVL